jgi:hypothetical protein
LALRKIVGNALIAYSPILAIEGALSHTNFHLRRRWTTAGFLASVIPIVIDHLASTGVRPSGGSGRRRSAPRAINGLSPSRCSTSITSSRSTTPTAMWPAMRC